MAAGAHVRAAHPAVAGEEGAAAAQREAVGGVVAEEGRPARHRRHAPLLPGAAAGQLAEVRQSSPRRAPRPLQRAVAQQRVTGHQVHRPQAWHMSGSILELETKAIRRFHNHGVGLALCLIAACPL